MTIQLGYVKFRNDGKVDQMKNILTFSGDLCLTLCLVAKKAEEKETNENLNFYV